MSAVALGIEAIEQGFVPDALTRLAIRGLCRMRLRAGRDDAVAADSAARGAFLASLREGPLAPVPEKANEQHYELPSGFFASVLGPRLKYSCCYWPSDTWTLAEAEEAALALTCERAQLDNGQDILELGCGWGSLSLWMAERYPASRITAVSNSVSQRRFIEAQQTRRGLTNLRVLTADMNDFAPSSANSNASGHDGRFDRVISVEMFEHMRNYELLLGRIASWLRPDGRLLVHLFCHRLLAYPFETTGAANWMGRYFFTGGIMPSADLLRRFDQHLCVVRDWTWSGVHYQRTAEAWLANLDAQRDEVRQVLETAYGTAAARRWLRRWRVFFLAVAEMFGYRRGREWQVRHYLMQPSTRPNG